ncbi:ubiquitin carboxyl-terminal hydrolase 47-like isoform X2 [Mugil cephalus]|uniref:ubiquitin carboxyl-terminal hydrolase 47-like isoform X2 n=1 Tax=Mugil cephalus TaxID=48193 RepID=UPI001FB5B649|nr:ubiquitin carboxyl-terminal hydrolase 47-like isoform X2 [Mugil cephalus]
MSSSRKRPMEERGTGQEMKKRRNKDAASQKHHCGLINQGATCYLNSVVQGLFMTSEIHDRLDPGSNSTDQQLRSIFDNLKETSCETKDLTRCLEIDNVSQQRDAAECLERILRHVSPDVSQVFEGALMCTTKCSKDHSIIEETNPFWTLPLSLGEKDDTAYSVEKGFERHFQPKSHSGDNQVFCNDCQAKTATTSGCEMVAFPHVLTILLKRFDFDIQTMSHFKSNCCVDIPRTLQIKDKKYTLYGIVNHIGSLRGGHYTATVLSKKDNAWYDCDDTEVRKVHEQPFENTMTYKSHTAYLLMYRACETDKVTEEHDEEGAVIVTPRRNRCDILKKPLVIGVTLFLAAVIIIVPIVVTQVNKT